MNRRALMSLIGGAALAWPLPGAARGAERRIGILMGVTEDEEGRIRVAAFESALRRLGWQGENALRLDWRWAGGDSERLRQFARELIDSRPDLLISNTTPAAVILRKLTSDIPVVFVSAADPVSTGLVATLARPGGNVTGFTNFEPSFAGKWLELLKDMAPWVRRLSIMYNPETAPERGEYYLGSLQQAAPAFGVELVPTRVRDRGEITAAIEALGRDREAGLFGMPDVFMNVHRDLVIALTAQYRVPGIYPFRYYATDGGLVSYGVDIVDLFVRAASYVDRILRGAKPADLPVQQPVKFELVINLKTAKALGLELPSTLLARANEVIE